MIKIIFSLLLFGYALSASGQVTRQTASPKLLKAFDKAIAQSRAGQTDKALASTEKLLKAEPKFVDAWLLKAGLHGDKRQPAEAEAAYEQALNLGAEESFPQTLRLLAQLEFDQEKYGEAAGHARRFLASKAAARAESGVKDGVRRLAENAEFAEGAIKKPVNVKRERLGNAINSPDPEYLPSLSADGRYFLFTRREQNRDENYWITEYTEAGWRPARPLDELNTPNLEGAASLTADGQMMFFSSEGRGADRGAGSFDIWYAPSKGNGKFGTPQRLSDAVNSAAWDAQPCLSANGKELFFASNRPGGKGGKDLYVSKLVGGKFSEAVPLGELNTPFDEQVPFLHPDGETLYFTSGGWPGMGDQDIFFARRRPDGTWSSPTNLGYPINTKDDEGSLFVSTDGKVGYYASRDLAKGERHDIYTLEMPEMARPKPVTYVKGRVLDARTRNRLKAKLKIVELDTKTTYDVSEGVDGFLACLPAGHTYGFYAEKDGYLFYSEHFALESPTSVTAPKSVEILLTPVTQAASGTTNAQPAKGSVVVLRNLLFDSGSAKLKPESETEVQAVLNLLQQYPGMRLRINGHTDHVGSAAANQTLSEARAKVLYDVLVQRGIQASRLSYKGYGDTKPIADNQTEAGRSLNRRTEIEVE